MLIRRVCCDVANHPSRPPAAPAAAPGEFLVTVFVEYRLTVLAFFLVAVASGPFVANRFNRVAMFHPTQQSGFDLFHRKATECVKWSCRIHRTQSGVRHQVAADLLRMGVTNGFVQRLGPFEVEVCVVFPAPVDMDDVFTYFAIKWNVTDEYTAEPEFRNTTHAHYLNHAFQVVKYLDNNDELSREDMDDVSVHGWEVRSVGSLPTH